MPVIEGIVLLSAGLIGHMLDPIMLVLCIAIAWCAADVAAPIPRWWLMGIAACVLATGYEALAVHVADLGGLRRPDHGNFFLLFCAAMADMAIVQWIVLRSRAVRAARNQQ